MRLRYIDISQNLPAERATVQKLAAIVATQPSEARTARLQARNCKIMKLEIKQRALVCALQEAKVDIPVVPDAQQQQQPAASSAGACASSGARSSTDAAPTSQQAATGQQPAGSAPAVHPS